MSSVLACTCSSGSLHVRMWRVLASRPGNEPLNQAWANVSQLNGQRTGSLRDGRARLVMAASSIDR